MCTAASFQAKDHYFGRTLDYEFSYGEEVTITPRNYRFSFTNQLNMPVHYAIIGMAHVADQYPLYYDAVNEAGLCIAGLNFVGNAVYHAAATSRAGIAQYELIPWLLGQCATIQEVKSLLVGICITDKTFGENYPLAQLHWIISDKTGSLTVESVQDGLKIYENPVGVLTNNPPFDMQMFALNNYMGISAKEPMNRFSKDLPLHSYSRGMGALGLPGDLSSQSRFIRAAFTNMNAISREGEKENVSQFFHILGTVEQTMGCCTLENGKHEITIYTSCCNASRGIYYVRTYDNHQIQAVDMHRVDLDANQLFRYPATQEENIRMLN